MSELRRTQLDRMERVVLSVIGINLTRKKTRKCMQSCVYMEDEIPKDLEYAYLYFVERDVHLIHQVHIQLTDKSLQVSLRHERLFVVHGVAHDLHHRVLHTGNTHVQLLKSKHPSSEGNRLLF